VEWKDFQDHPPTEVEIKQWWDHWPNANIAIPTGEAAGIDVIDIDVGHDENWVPPGCELPGACVVRCGGRSKSAARGGVKPQRLSHQSAPL